MNSRERRALAAARHNEQRRAERDLELYEKWLEANTQDQRLDERVIRYIRGRKDGLCRLAALALATSSVLIIE